ncbi:MAG: nucleotidyltransferase family protein [Panacagrimonas sp.]
MNVQQTAVANADAEASRRIVGLIPAAGRATRLGSLPCSKELLPVGFMPDPHDASPRPKPVSLYVIEQMRRAGASQLCIVLRSGKWDIAEYYGDGSRLGLSMGYFLIDDSWGPPFTASRAAPFIRDATVLFGFPDLLLDPPDLMAQVLARLDRTGADIVLGLCPMHRAGALSDVVRTDASGRVTSLEPKEQKPARGASDWTWLAAAWRPRFTAFMEAEVVRLSESAIGRSQASPPEWPFGSIVAAAIRAGMHVDSVGDESWSMLDTGTPQGLIAARAFPGVWSGEGGG